MRRIRREERHDESMVTGQRGTPRSATPPIGRLPLGKSVSRRSADVRLVTLSSRTARERAFYPPPDKGM